jgi:hypothetical protein
MIACFNNKNKQFLKKKVHPVTYCEFILDLALLNVSGSHFLKLCISRGKLIVFDSEGYHLDLLVIHLFKRKKTYLRIVTDKK